MIIKEIASQYDFGKCPYNSNHKFNPQKYFYHISKCKDGQKVKHLYKSCQFNPLHIFLLDDIWQHETICPERFQSLKKTNALQQALLNMDKLKSEQQTTKTTQVSRKNKDKYKKNITLQQCKDECCHLLLKVQLIIDQLSEQKRKKLKKLLQNYDALWQKQQKLKSMIPKEKDQTI